MREKIMLSTLSQKSKISNNSPFVLESEKLVFNIWRIVSYRIKRNKYFDCKLIQWSVSLCMTCLNKISFSILQLLIILSHTHNNYIRRGQTTSRDIYLLNVCDTFCEFYFAVRRWGERRGRMLSHGVGILID